MQDLLKALHGHCLKHEPRGWTQLERTACRLRYAACLLDATVGDLAASNASLWVSVGAANKLRRPSSSINRF